MQTNNTTATATNNFNSLKTRQQAFIIFLHDNGIRNTLVKREELQILSVKYGLGSPPAWIVRDLTRRTKRGYYEIPELADYMNQNQDAA